MGIVPPEFDLGAQSTERLAACVGEERPVVVLLPMGVVEPHGPHLPLETDTIISLGAAVRAATMLACQDVTPLIAPAVPYGVTRYAAGFTGAVSVDSEALIAFTRGVIRSLLQDGMSHVCLVNNHLEPEHVRALEDAIRGFSPTEASLACPTAKRWARTLSDEFKSGACHAGRYETSIVMALLPERVDDEALSGLPDVPISLSKKIRDGVSDFVEMGLTRSYAGSPATADAAHGEEQIGLLATMIATVALEAMGLGTGQAPE